MSQININNEPSAEVIIDENGTPVTVVVNGGVSGAIWGTISGTLSNQTDLQNALDDKVNKSGDTMTGDLNFTSSGINETDFVQFNTGFTDGITEGRMQWNDTDGTLEIGLPGSTINADLIANHEKVVNKTGSPILRGKIVYINGNQGNRPTVTYSTNATEGGSSKTFGILEENINDNGSGYVMTAGLFKNINTSTYVAGQTLYLGTNGDITGTKPVAPAHMVSVGKVIDVGNSGSIYVTIQNGYEIDELHDVLIVNPTNGQTLVYNNGLWENGAGGGGGGTVTNVSALTLGTSGTDLSSTVANPTTTPVITLNVPTASATNRGVLSSADWTTFNSKQNALTNPVTGTGTSGQVSYWTGSTTQSGSNNLFWDAVNNRLGINTNSPTASLDNRGLVSITGTSASDGGQLGSELLSSANWTLNSGWTGDFATGFSHSSGTATLTNTLAAVTNTYYLISYTVTNRTAGTFSIAFGGTTTSGLSATGSTGPIATSNASLVVTPTTDFNGTIVFSIKVITGSTASIQLRNSAGTITNEIRNDSSNTNTLIGLSAGARNLGTANTFIGSNAGSFNTTAIENTFVGRVSGVLNTIGTANSFFGAASGYNNTTGTSNSFYGVNSGFNNTTGGNNSFFGRSSGQNNTTGGNNSFVGLNSGLNSTTGTNNVFFGTNAGRNINAGTNLTVVSNSVFLGQDTRALADSDTNEIVIGNAGRGLGSNTTVIGNTSTTFGRFYGNLLLGTDTNGGFLLDVNGTARIVDTFRFDANIFDNRGNVIIQQSSSATATNRDLTIGNGTYGRNMFTSKSYSFTTGTHPALGSYTFYHNGETATSVTAVPNIYFKAQTPQAATNNNGGDFIIELPSGTGTGRNGRVAIGNTSPSYSLDLTGTFRVTGASQFEGDVTITDADNLVLGTSTGTKIGTATSQKLGFFNATPVVQPSAVTTTQGIADALTSLGLLASSTIAGGGGGSVTSVSVVSANGFAGTVANASTTPAITLTTTITGLLKGNGTAISSATANTDYLTPYSISTKTTTYTETAINGEIVLLGDTTSAGFTITLPTAVSNTAKITIKKIAGANNLTIDGNGSQTIDGGLTATLVRIYESITLVSDNSNWHII